MPGGRKRRRIQAAAVAPDPCDRLADSSCGCGSSSDRRDRAYRTGGTGASLSTLQRVGRRVTIDARRLYCRSIPSRMAQRDALEAMRSFPLPIWSASAHCPSSHRTSAMVSVRMS